MWLVVLNTMNRKENWSHVWKSYSNEKGKAIQERIKEQEKEPEPEKLDVGHNCYLNKLTNWIIIETSTQNTVHTVCQHHHTQPTWKHKLPGEQCRSKYANRVPLSDSFAAVFFFFDVTQRFPQRALRDTPAHKKNKTAVEEANVPRAVTNILSRKGCARNSHILYLYMTSFYLEFTE